MLENLRIDPVPGIPLRFRLALRRSRWGLFLPQHLSKLQWLNAMPDQAVSIESNANPLFFAPDDTACALGIISLIDQRESVGNIERRHNFQGRPGVRYVSNRAVKHATTELDRAGL